MHDSAQVHRRCDEESNIIYIHTSRNKSNIFLLICNYYRGSCFNYCVKVLSFDVKILLQVIIQEVLNVDALHALHNCPIKVEDCWCQCSEHAFIDQNGDLNGSCLR